MKINIESIVNDVYKEMQKDSNLPRIENIDTFYCIILPDGYKYSYHLTIQEAEKEYKKLIK